MFRRILSDKSFAAHEVCSLMHIIAIGRLRACPEADLFARYNTRLRPQLTVGEIPEARGNAVVAKRQEGAALLSALPRNAFAVPLDLGAAPSIANLWRASCGIGSNWRGRFVF